MHTQNAVDFLSKWTFEISMLYNNYPKVSQCAVYVGGEFFRSDLKIVLLKIIFYITNIWDTVGMQQFSKS